MKNFEDLTKDWEEWKKSSSAVSGGENAKKQWEEFTAKWGKDKLKSIELKSYTNLISENEEYFTHWIERKTVDCGSLGATWSKFGIYRNNKEGVKTYSTFEGVTDLTSDPAEGFFKREIYTVILKLAEFDDINENVGDKMNINFARKIAYMYHPGKLIPIFTNDVIERIADYLGIDEVDLTSYKATEPILNKLKEVLNLQAMDFEITQKLMRFLWELFGEPFGVDAKNVIFHGAPGTGKTYTVQKGLEQQIKYHNTKRDTVLEFAQFHPSFSYEDFIEGLKPVLADDGKSVHLKLQSGRFKKFCKKAADDLKNARKKNNKPNPYYFVADEINRAELSRVFGEVLVCLEESKRIDFDKNGEVVTGLYLKTQYGHLDNQQDAILTIEGEHYFGVPSNLYFIGTMNDIDRSVDSFDLALRRRFVWKHMGCDYKVIAKELEVKDELLIKEYIEKCKAINNLIVEDDGANWGLGSNYEIGHAYFLAVGNITESNVAKLFDNRIQPLLKEYLRAEYSQADVKKKLKQAKKAFCG